MSEDMDFQFDSKNLEDNFFDQQIKDKQNHDLNGMT